MTDKEIAGKVWREFWDVGDHSVDIQNSEEAFDKFWDVWFAALAAERDDETNYGRLERLLREAPATFIPPLLIALIETAEKKKVFQKGGAVNVVKKTIARYKER